MHTKSRINDAIDHQSFDQSSTVSKFAPTFLSHRLTMLVMSSSFVRLLNETISFLRFARWLMFFSRVRPESCRFNVVMFFVDSTEQCFNNISSVNSSNLKNMHNSSESL